MLTISLTRTSNFHRGVAFVAAALVALFGSSARAEDPVTEWRILGPAFSYHFTQEGALSSHGPVTWTCNAAHVRASVLSTGPAPQRTTYSTFKVSATPYVATKVTNAMGYTSTVNMPAASVAAALQAPAVYGRWNYTTDNKNAAEFYTQTNYTVTGANMASYNEVTCGTSGLSDPVKERWHQNNPAFGVERAWRYSGHVDKVFATYVRDSYGTASVMVAASRQWPLASVGTLSLDGGLAAGVWRRSELDSTGYGLRRETIPFAMPAFTVNESETGVGMNMAFAPKIVVNEQIWNATPTLMFQFTYLLQRTSPGRPRVGIERSAGGGVEASYAVGF